jgi:hypothetical protein
LNDGQPDYKKASLDVRGFDGSGAEAMSHDLDGQLRRYDIVVSSASLFHSFFLIAIYEQTHSDTHRLILTAHTHHTPALKATEQDIVIHLGAPASTRSHLSIRISSPCLGLCQDGGWDGLWNEGRRAGWRRGGGHRGPTLMLREDNYLSLP